MRGRIPAKRMYLSEVSQGFFIKNEGDFEPNYLISPLGEKAFRLKTVATIVAGPYFSDDNSYARVLLDDSTSVLWAAAFRERAQMLKRLYKGDLVQVIAKPHEWQETKQLTIETITKVEPGFLILSRAETLLRYLRFKRDASLATELIKSVGDIRNALELAPQKNIDPEIIEGLDELDYLMDKKKEETIDFQKLEIVKQRLLDKISYLQDTENGVDIDVLIVELDPEFTAAEVEEALKSLLALGEIFEPTVGHYMIA